MWRHPTSRSGAAVWPVGRPKTRPGRPPPPSKALRAHSRPLAQRTSFSPRYEALSCTLAPQAEIRIDGAAAWDGIEDSLAFGSWPSRAEAPSRNPYLWTEWTPVARAEVQWAVPAAVHRMRLRLRALPRARPALQARHAAAGRRCVSRAAAANPCASRTAKRALTARTAVVPHSCPARPCVRHACSVAQA